MRLRVLVPIAAAAMLTAPAAASAGFPHVVASGESLSSVAASDGLTVDQLAAANGLPPDAWLPAGSTLMIPAQTAEAVAAARQWFRCEMQGWKPKCGSAGAACIARFRWRQWRRFPLPQRPIEGPAK